MKRDQLEQKIRQGIPITESMQFRVLELTENSIRVQGGGEQNINVHGTAFAGSLYTMCTLAAWGLVTSRLPGHASLVMAEGSIRYRKPVNGNIVAYSEIPERAISDFLARVKKAGKGWMEVTVLVHRNDAVAVEFKAKLYASIQV
jgi:thioesterase domain-containing protein